MTSSKKRIVWIDTAKAIAILFVIIGHSVSGQARAVIFSFHMPLFFIFSAWTSRFSENPAQFWSNTKRSFKHLIIPALIIFLIHLLISCIKMVGHNSLPEWGTFFARRGLTLLFSSGVKTEFLGMEVPALGIPWFLIVLFFCRTFYDILQLVLKKNFWVTGIVAFLISLAGVLIGRRLFLFFSLDIALAAIILIWFAPAAKKTLVPENSPWLKAGIFLAIWILCFAVPYILIPDGEKRYLEFASRDYPLFPVCFIGGAAATMFIAEVCVLLNRLSLPFRLMDALNYLGKNSLYMLYVHCFDYYWSSLYTITDNLYIQAVLRVVIDIIAFIILMLVRKYLLRFRKKAA